MFKKEQDIDSIAGLRLKLDATVAAVIGFVVPQQAMVASRGEPTAVLRE